MKIKQLSLFLENKPGHLSAICKALAGAGVNIATLSLADTQQFGILRLIIEEWEKARDVLEKAGFVVNVTEVVATEVDDRPGGLAEILDVLEKAGVNIEYMYAFTGRLGAKAILVLRLDNPDSAVKLLASAGRNILAPVDLFGKKA
ncbi:MAG: ACT domain-containing protein [bacterium]